MLQQYRNAKNWWMRVAGRRGSALMFFAFLDLVYCWSLLSLSPEAKESKAFKFIDSIMPLPIWASLWGIAGVVCLFSAFRRKDSVAFTVAITIKIIWAIVFFAGEQAGDIYRGYVQAAIWSAMAALVKVISGWPETPLKGEQWIEPH